VCFLVRVGLILCLRLWRLAIILVAGFWGGWRLGSRRGCRGRGEGDGDYVYEVLGLSGNDNEAFDVSTSFVLTSVSGVANAGLFMCLV